MATCKDCLHFEVCDCGRHIGEYNDDIDEGTYTDGVEKECPTFKNKADVVEVVHCNECLYKDECCKEIHFIESGYIAIDHCSYGKRRVIKMG